MKTVNKRLIGLLSLALVQICFPLYFIFQKEKVISEGQEFKFSIQPVDPYDFFQGRYVDLNVRSLGFPSKNLKDLKQYDMIYVEFESDSFGTKIKSVSKEKTLNSIKLKLYSNLEKTDTIWFRLPFKRFYLEEYNAKKVEFKLARNNSKRNFVHVKIRNGDFVITDISSNGKSLVNGNELFKNETGK